jgi:hypothetical protein
MKIRQFDKQAGNLLMWIYAVMFLIPLAYNYI